MMFLDFFYFSRPIDRKRQVRVYVATDGNFRNHSNNSDPCLTKISTLISGNILLEQYQYLAIYCWAIYCSSNILPEQYQYQYQYWFFEKLQYQYQYQYWKSDWFVSLQQDSVCYESNSSQLPKFNSFKFIFSYQPITILDFTMAQKRESFFVLDSTDLDWAR